MGKLDINLIPVEEDGESEIPEEKISDDPSELLG
jgi:hypothetical protein